MALSQDIANYQTQAGEGFSAYIAGFYTYLVAMPT